MSPGDPQKQRKQNRHKHPRPEKRLPLVLPLENRLLFEESIRLHRVVKRVQIRTERSEFSLALADSVEAADDKEEHGEDESVDRNTRQSLPYLAVVHGDLRHLPTNSLQTIAARNGWIAIVTQPSRIHWKSILYSELPGLE